MPVLVLGLRLLFHVADPKSGSSSASSWTSSGPRPGRGRGRRPGHVLFGGRGVLEIPSMPTSAMISVIVGWIVGWSVIGAWRMMTRDA